MLIYLFISCHKRFDGLIAIGLRRSLGIKLVHCLFAHQKILYTEVC